MGWSCNRDAGLTLDALKRFCVQQNGSSNTYTSKGTTYFFEISRNEHSDGAITGTIWKIQPDGMCRRSGSLRIEGDGTISRGPAILKKVPVYRLDLRLTNGHLIRVLYPYEVVDQENLSKAAEQWENVETASVSTPDGKNLISTAMMLVD